MKNPDGLSDEAVLTLAQELIRDPLKWTQNTLARDRDGHSVEPYGDDAVSFCAAGAIAHVLGVRLGPGGAPRFEAVWSHLKSYPPVLAHRMPAHFNNTRAHGEVMAMFDWGRKHAAQVAAFV